jgi:hypothetical protein
MVGAVVGSSYYKENISGLKKHVKHAIVAQSTLHRSRVVMELTHANFASNCLHLRISVSSLDVANLTRRITDHLSLTSEIKDRLLVGTEY